MQLRITEILQQAYGRRKIYIQDRQLEAYRLLHLEESILPVAIDIYKENAVLHLFEKIEKKLINELQESLKQILKIQSFFFKNRTKENMDLPHSEAKKLMVEEYGHQFSLNLSEYLDTGLFLDHRETRRWIESQSKNKKVLNTFAYTGSFSIYAAAGGAEKTFSVDLSKTYCEWIKQNLELNHLPPEKNWVYKMDTLEFFKYAKKKNLKFDIIIIDPPTFSKNKGQHFSVQKDYPLLINNALGILESRGFILFSNNCKTFQFDRKKLQVSGEPVTIIERKDLIPADFPGLKPHHCFIIAKN